MFCKGFLAGEFGTSDTTPLLCLIDETFLVLPLTSEAFDQLASCLLDTCNHVHSGMRQVKAYFVNVYIEE